MGVSENRARFRTFRSRRPPPPVGKTNGPRQELRSHMPVLTLALKDLRLLLRDARSAVLLLLMPLVLALALGEGFGEKPDDRLRISIVNLDNGLKNPTGFPGKPWSEVVIDDL